MFLSNYATAWDTRCLAVLERHEGRYHDREMAVLIEIATGMRFTAKTVQRYRLAAGLTACTRNDWTPRFRLTSASPIGAYT